MLNRLQFWILTVLAVAALALVVFNAFFFSGNRALQAQLSAQTQYVQQSLQLEPLHQTIIRDLIELAARNNDTQIRDLLVANGISFTVTAPPKTPDPAPSNAERAKR